MSGPTAHWSRPSAISSSMCEPAEHDGADGPVRLRQDHAVAHHCRSRRPLHGRDRHAPRMRAIGFMFQEPRLLPWRTVRQNIELVVLTPDIRRPISIASPPRSASPTCCRAIRRSFRSASPAGSRLPAPSPRGPTSCCWTSLSSPSTIAPPTVCAVFCSRSGRRGRPRRSSSPTTPAKRSCSPTGSCCLAPRPTRVVASRAHHPPAGEA